MDLLRGAPLATVYLSLSKLYFVFIAENSVGFCTFGHPYTLSGHLPRFVFTVSPSLGIGTVQNSQFVRFGFFSFLFRSVLPSFSFLGGVLLLYASFS